ncbi:hypothetical protein ESCO_000169 [Escovopsis weberi]|uniref:Uncharacterized protein n=1 Tax=Escovopsis weberi TaxID=150374 RepID=A0A0M8N3W4_ESCWE|nr:hypothetical protein ESCO_000169 [Escovopsis weberi]
MEAAAEEDDRTKRRAHIRAEGSIPLIRSKERPAERFFRREVDKQPPVVPSNLGDQEAAQQVADDGSKDWAPKSRKSGSSHSCEWRSKFVNLTTDLKQLKTELNALDDQGGAPTRDAPGKRREPTSRMFPDSGIEGLTVIVHRRYKEDLVLNTRDFLEGQASEKRR